MARKQGSHSEITGPKVRASALKLFARHGFAAVSMRQIAADVGVQAGALYTYTPDKQSLLADLMRGHLTALLEAWAKERDGASAITDLQRFVAFHLHYHFDRPDEVFVAYMELRNLTDANFEDVERLRQEYEGALREILERGATSGEFRIVEPAVTTRALIALLTGVNTWYRDGQRLSREDVVEIYWGLVAGSVGLKEDVA